LKKSFGKRITSGTPLSISSFVAMLDPMTLCVGMP
jgi:hypothetical protein